MSKPVLYRYEDRSGAVFLEKLPVVRRTPKGVWVDYYGRNRFVLDGTLKTFACATEEQAKVSFLARKAKQKKILKAQLENIDAAVAAIKEGKLGMQPCRFDFVDFSISL